MKYLLKFWTTVEAEIQKECKLENNHFSQIQR